MPTFKLGQKDATDLKVYMRPTDKWQFTNRFDPRTWASSTVFAKGEYCKPSTANGFKFLSNGGRSGSTEPTWAVDEGETTTDGSIEWVAYPDLFALEPGETVTGSTWTATAGVTLGTDQDAGFEPSFSDSTSSAWVIDFDADFSATSFILTNVIVTSAGRSETVKLKISYTK